MHDPFMQMVFAQVAAKIEDDSKKAGQFTLGRLIETLETFPAEAKCDLCGPHSYRGYYEQLAFERDSSATVATALADAKGAMGMMFEGYKGGDYWMTGRSWVWVANYGSCGDRIVGLQLIDGRVTVITAPSE